MSRIAVALLLASPAPALAAEPITAEQAMKKYRETFAPVATANCAVSDNPDEIVVCGRRSQDPRLPFPVEPEPGAVQRLGPNELRSGTTAMAGGGCLRLCHQPVQVDVIKTVKAIAGGIDRLLNGD